MVDGKYKYITDVCRFATITSVEYVKKGDYLLLTTDYDKVELVKPYIIV